jgi:ABC transport system ATP-binding/permease protein
MDEPTNDLDIETLELLEEMLIDYPGTLLLVSHDREFLNNVVTSTLVLEGEGRVKDYAGGYDDWLRQRGEKETGPLCPPSDGLKSNAGRAAGKAALSPFPPEDRPRRLTYKEQIELEALPDRIAALEADLAGLHATMADPAFYRQEPAAIVQAKNRLQSVEQDIAAAYGQWEELESRRE